MFVHMFVSIEQRQKPAAMSASSDFLAICGNHHNSQAATVLSVLRTISYNTLRAASFLSLMMI